ncbi:hypothetical protein MLD38_014121 [Melastoma candidum]|uniref:Uncharacterized protein n=1 Tax=Melastoma candidum TaxID=119954 RepID=A0ACB9RBQ0_9MYRT|nr:hypothetical protein MLD38_014121 [Melastoma candidum]
MHSFSTSSSKSGDNSGKSTKAAVSKLIQAFESKSQNDDNEEEVGLSEDQSRQDLHTFSLEQIQNLREIFKPLASYTRSATAQHRRGVDGRVASDLTIMDLKTRLDILDEHVNNLESSYIEVRVLGEVLNQGIFYVMSRNGELGTLYGSLKEQNSVLQTEIVELNDKLRESTAVGVIESLRERLERVSEDHESVIRSLADVNVELSDLQGLNDRAAGLLRKIHGNLKELVFLSQRFMGLDDHSAEENVNIDPLDAGSYHSLTENLRTIVDERRQLESKIDDLQSQLKSRMDDIQELNGRSLDMDFTQKFIKEAETVMKLEGANIDFNAGPASCLESLFAFVLKKYIGNDHIYNSREISASGETRSSDLTEKLNQSNYQNNQHEEEILILREIEWLCKALSDANDERSLLQQKIDDFDKYCSSLTADREKLQGRITRLEVDLHSNTLEKGQLLERLDRSMRDQEDLEVKARHLELENDRLQSEANAMKRRLA